MKKCISFIACFLVLSTVVMTTAFAKTDVYTQAYDLYYMGLLSGSGTNQDGSPNFEFDRMGTRSESVAMLVRLLGKEKEALAQNNMHPFLDVDSWASPYVGYAYAQKLVNGTSSTTFGGKDQISLTQYYTLLLRALGYSSDSDFKWNDAVKFGEAIGLQSNSQSVATDVNKNINRLSLISISHSALACYMKGTSTMLIQQLIDNGAISAESIPLSFSGLVCFSQTGSANYTNTIIPDFGKTFGIELTDGSENIYFYRNNSAKIDDYFLVYTALLESIGFEQKDDVRHVENDTLNIREFYYENPNTGECADTIRIRNFKGNAVLAGIKTGSRFTKTEMYQLAGFYIIDGTQIFFPSNLSETNVLSEQQVAGYYADAIRGAKSQLKYPDMAKFDVSQPVIMSYDDKTGNLELFGQVSACNAFGVYSTVDYFCEFDLTNNTYKTFVYD